MTDRRKVHLVRRIPLRKDEWSSLTRCGKKADILVRYVTCEDSSIPKEVTCHWCRWGRS